jgi:hypothetical protein
MAKKSKSKTLSPAEVISKGWHDFNRDLSKLTEDQLDRALELELRGKNRQSYVERIHTRFNTMRVDREKKELSEKAVT